MSGLNWQLAMQQLGSDYPISSDNITSDDTSRIKKTEELGLPKTATWADINTHFHLLSTTNNSGNKTQNS